MKKKLLIIFTIFIGIFLLSSISSYTFVVEPKDINGFVQPNTTFLYTWDFTTDLNCSNIVASETKTITTDFYGRGFHNFTIFPSQTPNYICEYRNSSLRKVFKIQNGYFNNVYANNINAEFFIGDGSQLTGVLKEFNEQDPFWTANFSLYNTSWSKDTTYSHLSNFTNDLGIGNWTFDKSNYFTSNQILNFNYYNSTNFPFDINDYYLKTEINNLLTSIGNWSLDKSFYYNSTEVDNLLNNYYNSTEVNTIIGSVGNWTADKDSVVNLYTKTYTINPSGGNGVNITEDLEFEITQITVTPSNLTAQYRFEATETTSGDYVDKNRKVHTGIWSIYKSHSIDDSITLNIINSEVDNIYTVEIKFLDDYRP